MSVDTLSVRRSSLGLIASSLVLFAFLSTASAHNGPALAENVQSWREDGESRWLLQTNFGVMTSESPNRYVCEEAFGGGVRFRVAAFDTDTWVAFTPSAIQRTDDGCNFEKVRDLPSEVIDVAVRRESREVAYLLSGPETSGIWMSSDAGASFEEVSVGRPNLKLTQIGFVGDGNLAVSAHVSGDIEGAEQGDGRILTTANPDDALVVDDYAYPELLDAREGQLLWQGRRNERQHVVWGTLESPVGASRGVEGLPRNGAIDPETGDVWVGRIGQQGRGLLHGVRDGETVEWEVVDEEHTASCLSASGGELYACSRRPREGYDLEHRTEQGDVEAAVDFRQLEGPRASCADDSGVGTACPLVWDSLEEQLENSGSSGGSDAGSGGDVEPGGDANLVADTSEQTSAGGGDAQGGGGCGTVSGAKPVPLAILVMLSGLVCLRRSRTGRSG
jgi:hypothetical protein